MSHSLSVKSRCTKDSSHGPALPKDLQPQGCIKTSHPPAGVVIEALKAYLIVQKVSKEGSILWSEVFILVLPGERR